MEKLRDIGVFVAGGAGIALLAWLAYAVVFSTLPYIRQPKACGQMKEQFKAKRFYGSAADGPDRAALIESTTDAFGARVQLVRTAERTLDIAYHSIARGITTGALAWEVWQAAERGVRVRFLLDDKLGLSGAAVESGMRLLCSHPNVECRLYNPSKLLRPWAWHSLMHDKFILADGAFLLLGGRNLGDRYFAPSVYTGEVAQDRDVLIWNIGPGTAGSVMEQVAEYMQTLWELPCTKKMKGTEGPKKAEDHDVHPFKAMATLLRQSDPAFYAKTRADFLGSTVPTRKVTLIHNPVCIGSKRPWVGYQLQQLTLRAEKRVLIQTPYATANRKLLDTLWRVAVNADVTMVTNTLANSPNLPAFSNYLARRGRFVATGAQIYEYQGKDSIHGKSVVIDGRLSAVGSFNLDDRSLYIDTETMLVIDSAPFADILTGAIQAYQSQSLLVGLDNRHVEDDAVPAAPEARGKKAVMALAALFLAPIRFLV